uniref:Uncharacterized protein n=1 Tax=Physcomitrium patens TaxID=3218 RepID=A0A2K1IDB6_PHYPA|nr:hypothetical protein PHYPA_029423 [Physcomitrium patens]
MTIKCRPLVLDYVVVIAPRVCSFECLFLTNDCIA